VFGDVHGNLPALKAVYSSIESSPVEQVICLGDLAFKGPQPGECVSFVRRMSIPVVSGNTDDELCSVYKQGSSNELPARPSAASIPCYRWHSDRMTADDMEYLAALPGCHVQTQDGGALRFSHCPPPETGQDLVAVIYGHTHVPIVMQGRPHDCGKPWHRGLFP